MCACAKSARPIRLIGHRVAQRHTVHYIGRNVTTLMLQLFAVTFFGEFWIQNILLVLNFAFCFGRGQI